MLNERALVTTLLAAQPTRRLRQLLLVIVHQVNFYFILLEERFPAQLTLERLEASVNLGMSKKIESFGEAFTTNVAIKRRSIGCSRSIVVRENFRLDEMCFDVSLEHIRVFKGHVTFIA